MRKILTKSILFFIFTIYDYIKFIPKCFELMDRSNQIIKITIKDNEKFNIYEIDLGSSVDDLNSKYHLNLNEQELDYSFEYNLFNDQVIERDVKRIDNISINKADRDDLTKLPGVGSITANTIIEYREKYNGFKSLDELMNVKGIGKKKYEKIKPYISL